MRRVLLDSAIDWRSLIAALEASGEALALELDGQVYGLVLPAAEAQLLVAAHEDKPAPRADAAQPGQRGKLLTYLELLRDDPTLLPVVAGEALEFVTMMNSSYIDPRQLYVFRSPQTRQQYTYRADELQALIGRVFGRVEIIPQRPRDVVEGKVGL